MKKPGFLKFDGVHPHAYLKQIQIRDKELIARMDFEQYHQWLMDQKINYSDFYSWNLANEGWRAHDFVINDAMYIEKVADYLWGKKKSWYKWKESVKNKIRPADSRWTRYVVKAFINHYNPDVIFVREGNPLPSSFWGEFSTQALLVNRIAMNFPKIWNPMYFDLIFTSLESYKAVFESNDIPAHLFYDGFDQRINRMLEGTQKSVDVSHAGGAGKHLFKEKTELLDAVAGQFDLHWYGWGAEKLEPESALMKAWKGYVSGIEMYRLYKQSRIVLNDYGNVAKGTGVNQRIFEALGVGSFLLTREASNLKERFPEGIMITFKDTKDCLDKISYFLKNENEREEIAAAGKKFAEEELNYANLMKDMDRILREHLGRKFG